MGGFLTRYPGRQLLSNRVKYKHIRLDDRQTDMELGLHFFYEIIQTIKLKETKQQIKKVRGMLVFTLINFR